MIPIISVCLNMALYVMGSPNPQAGQLPKDLSGYKVAELELKGAILFDSEQLINVFPIKNGDPFNPKLVKEGLERIHQLFSNFGYIDLIYTPHLLSFV